MPEPSPPATVTRNASNARKSSTEASAVSVLDSVSNVAMAPSTGLAGSQDELSATLRAFADVGADEVQLIPTSADLNQLRAAAEVVAGL